MATPEKAEGPGWVWHARLAEPSLQDNTADAERLEEALRRAFKFRRLDMTLSLRRQLPAVLRDNDFNVRCLLFQDLDRAVLLHVGPDDARCLLGLAVDLGTTRVVMRLVDLDQRRMLAEKAFDNPQAAIGPDILARIHHADQPGGLQMLQALIIQSLNRNICDLCQSLELTSQAVYLVTVAGNTTMSHLLTGLPVHWMIREPYIPATNRFGLIPADQLGLAVASQAQVFVFPNVGSYFGGDLIAGILYAGLHQRAETAILVDVGTNAEVVLGNQDWLMACAGAAGPALEGGVTRIGTTAKPGVIDRVRIDPGTGRFDLHTIDDLPPVGICGSGVIDLAAQLFLAGMIDIRGKFRPDQCGDRLTTRNGLAHLRIAAAGEVGAAQDLSISQADMDSLIRSKAAMYTILETITGTTGMGLKELETFYVAGTFGSFIDPMSAITLGMIPDLPLDCYRMLGNSSLGGATLALTSSDAAAQINQIRDRVTYLELNVNQEFMNRFSAAKFIPHTDTHRFPSVKIP